MPLVSVTVITYNSGKYVVETLNSIKNQTYQNIELIISDDCSSDDTFVKCEKWITQNRERFSNVVLLRSEINTGIPANKNRSILASKGNWIKSIAGDDILHENCVSSNLQFAITNNHDAVFSKVQVFNHIFSEENFLFVRPFDVRKKFYSETITCAEQYRVMLYTNQIPAPSVFIKRDVLLDLGLFDLKFPFVEDYPMYLKVVKNGYKFAFLPEVTVYYRIHQNTLSNSKININFLDSTNAFLFSNIYSKSNFIRKCSIHWQNWLTFLLSKTISFSALSRLLNVLRNRLDPNFLNILYLKYKRFI